MQAIWFTNSHVKTVYIGEPTGQWPTERRNTRGYPAVKGTQWSSIGLVLKGTRWSRIGPVLKLVWLISLKRSAL